MREIVFDLEVFPNWWCMVYNIPPNEEMFVITSRDYDYKKRILDLRIGNCWIGFNIKGYDLRILNAIISDADPQRVYETSCAIINDEADTFNNYFFWNKFNFCDLYDDWKFGSLKEFESNIGMSIEESEVSFDKKDLTEEDIADIIKYCKHDVLATVKLLEYRRDYVDSKKTLSEMYNIPLDKALKSTNAKLASVILGAQLVNRHQDYNFKIPEKVHDYIYSWLPRNVIDLFSIISDETKEVYLFDNTINFGIGGIHSTIGENCVCRSTEDEVLMNVDVTSYYPNLLMKFNYMSRNCKDPKMYENVYNLRVKLKKEMGIEERENGKTEKYYKLKSQQEALKLILNTTYGAMKNKYNALFDEYNASSLCYLGQMLLAALANRLYIETHCKIIQTNTDGILIKCKRDKIDLVTKIVHEWEDMTGMSMEFEDIDLFFQRDVNNYIEVKKGGKIKLKGKWTNQADDKRALSNLNAPITHKALLEYYINGTPVRDTIYACDSLFDFCFTSKTGHTYDKTYHYINDKPHLANKVNRVVATTKKEYGTIKKYKKGEDGKDRFDKIADLPEHAFLVNDDLSMISHLDRDWYVKFATDKIKELKEI